MSEMREVYKVVCQTRDRSLVSAWVKDKSFAVLYGVGVETVPTIEGSFLMAFEAEKQAVRWTRHLLERSCYWFTQPRVYRAEARVSGHRPGWIHCSSLSLMTQDRITQFWENESEAARDPSTIYPMRGTVFCESIKLIEEVASE